MLTNPFAVEVYTKSTDSKRRICQHGGGSGFGIQCRVLNAEFFVAIGGDGSVLGIQSRVPNAEFSKIDVWYLSVEYSEWFGGGGGGSPPPPTWAILSP